MLSAYDCTIVYHIPFVLDFGCKVSKKCGKTSHSGSVIYKNNALATCYIVFLLEYLLVFTVKDIITNKEKSGNFAALYML